MYRFLIVENEADAADTLRGYVERYATEHGVDISVDWATSAFEYVESHQRYDLIFMDIDLPGINGMEASQLIRVYDNETLIIFVTNLAQYAMKGYEVGALDFVVKPVTYRGLSMRLDRALRILRRNAGQQLCVTTTGGMRVFPTSSLVYVDIKAHDISYHLDDGSVVEARGTLNKLEEELDGGQFVRIASNCLVNAGHIREVEGQQVTMDDGTQLTMSRGKRKAALEALAGYFGGSR